MRFLLASLCAAAACTSPHLIATPDAGHKPRDPGERQDAATSDAGFDAGALDAGSDAGIPGDAGQDAGQDGGSDAGPVCTCSDGVSLCVVEGECANYCEVPAVMPGALARTEQDPRPKSTVFCVKAKDTDPDLTFDEVCKRRCLVHCERQAWFCAADLTTCQASCESADVKMACESDVTSCTGGDDGKKVTCLQQLCSAVKSTGCLDTVCPSDPQPDCTDVKCSNNPDKCVANFDGFCDDGDTFFTKPDYANNVETDSNLCAWGTDCADCGPRTGSDSSINLPLGAQCQYNKACAGNRQTIVNSQSVTDLETTEAWCVELSEVAVGDFRCVYDASGEGEHCPAGFKTQLLLGADTNGDGSPDPIKMGLLTAKVCLPASCH